MEILILCNNSSGLYSFRGMLIETLIKRGDSVTAVVPVTDSNNEIVSEENLRGIGCKLLHANIERRGMNPLKDAKLFFDYMKILSRQKPDFVITYTIKPNIYGGIACNIKKIPYAVNITGLGTAFESENIVKKTVCSLYKIALKKAKVVFFENVENRDIMVNLGLVKAEKTKVLPGAGVDLEKFSFIDYPKDDGETRFLFIGRVMKEKGIEELIGAMRRLISEGVNCSLDVVGGLEENYSETLKECEAEGWLRYHGVQNDVRPFIANAHCFVLPSWHEGMANTNLECAASGRPIITSNIHGCLEAVEEEKSGYLVDAKNSDSLYVAMKHFIEIPLDEKKNMGKCARKRMKKIFDKKEVIAETIKKIE